MIRALLWVLGALLLGGIVHLSTVLAMPQAAKQDAYARLAPFTPVNTVTPLAAPTAEAAVMPFMDPAFAVAVCRYDLLTGRSSYIAPVSQAYTSVTFYTRNERGLLRDQRPCRGSAHDRTRSHDARSSTRSCPRKKTVTAADRLIIESPSRHRINRAAGSRSRRRE